LERFIRYLYEYDQEKRIRNVGFVKVETGNEETIVHMQVKGFHNQEQKLGLYLFYEKNDKFVRVFQEEKALTSTILSWHYTYSPEDVGDPQNYSSICGMLIETDKGRRMAVTWDDKCVDVSRMEEFESEKEEALECEEVECEEVECEEVECDNSERQDCTQHHEETQDSRKKITKITRQDISRLPRCEWQLANNRFLLYGYNNFHHLLLIEEGNYLKLGVPGIYHIKEAKCAQEFGFEEFISCEELQNNAEIQEMNCENQDDYEIWGYWCRSVRRRQN